MGQPKHIMELFKGKKKKRISKARCLIMILDLIKYPPGLICPKALLVRISLEAWCVSVMMYLEAALEGLITH